jgi:hypothetical protein
LNIHTTDPVRRQAATDNLLNGLVHGISQHFVHPWWSNAMVFLSPAEGMSLTICR